MDVEFGKVNQNGMNLGTEKPVESREFVVASSLATYLPIALEVLHEPESWHQLTMACTFSNHKYLI